MSVRDTRRGFYWQDWYAAWVLLRCWRNPSEGIVKVDLEVDNVPSIDDIVVFRQGQVVFHQLKHTVHSSGRFTSSDLFSRKKGGPSLIAKLLRGWRRARGHGLPVEVVLATNAQASSAASNSVIPPSQLEERILTPCRLGSAWTPQPAQIELLRQIRDLSGASGDEEIRHFLGDLRLRFGEPSIENLRSRVESLLTEGLRPRSVVSTEAKAWVERVYDLATDSKRTKALDRTRIERELHQLFVAPHRRLEHRLALPDHHLVRSDVTQDLMKQATEMGDGYLLVMGPPGSGKTTLATYLADSYPEEILLRYHVFDPKRGASLERKARATSFTFVAEMLAALADRLPDTVGSRAPSRETELEAVEALWSELSLLGSRQRQIVLVDGIDHVIRAGLGNEPRLFDALRPDAPHGTTFLLFGQPGWPYPSWLQCSERFDLPPFTPPETSQYLATAMDWDPENPAVASVADAVQQRSKGNPLSIFYSVAGIRGDNSPEQVLESVPMARFFGNDPHEAYRLLLDDLSRTLPGSSRSLRQELMAWLAVAQTPLTAKRLSRAFGSDDELTERSALDVLQSLAPVLGRVGEGSFELRHDDFRRYAEARLQPLDSKKANARHAEALRGDHGRDEILPLAEHLWLGGCHAALAALPTMRALEDWITRFDRSQVLEMHRLGLSGALQQGDDLAILRNALALGLCADASPGWWTDQKLSFDSPDNLSTWSFVVPPKEGTGNDLRVRVDALVVAASRFADEPELAQTVVDRFALSDAGLRAAANDDAHYTSEYFAAWTRWLLVIGDPEAVLRLLQADKLSEGVVVSALEDFLSEKHEPAVLSFVVSSLLEEAERLEHALVSAILAQTVDGRLDAAGSILEPLLKVLADLPKELRRNVGFFGSLIQGHATSADDSLLSARVRWRQDSSTDPTSWREFFIHGFMTGSFEHGRSLEDLPFPDRFSAAMEGAEVRQDDVWLASHTWRCGAMAGIARRREALVRPSELSVELEAILVGRPDLDVLTRNTVIRGARVYLPLLALAVKGAPSLSSAMLQRLREHVEDRLSSPTEATYGALEAIWTLSPENWRSLAAEAVSRSMMPGSDHADRKTWFDYWLNKALVRGVDIPERFRRLSARCLLGVYRKTNPASLATRLLAECESDDGTAQRVRRLVDALIRTNAEPEAERAARRALPEALTVALESDGGLFLGEFLRATDEYGLAEPFGPLAGEIAECWLGRDGLLSSTELYALAHWVMASPELDPSLHPVCEKIEARLEQIGESARAQTLRQWRRAVPSDDAMELRSTETTPSQEGGTGSRAGLAASLDIKNVTSTWFSSWWSREENAFLLQHLADGGEPAWKETRQALAENLVEDSKLHVHTEAFAEGFLNVRSNLEPEDAFELALTYLEERVAFQEPPVSRPPESPSPGLSRAEALVRLIARGLDVSHTETILRALRALVALGRESELAQSVESAVLPRCHSEDDRSVAYSLVVLRELPILGQEADSAVCDLLEHPNAFCRWVASTIVGVDPSWPGASGLVAQAAPTIDAPIPSRREVGAAYYSDETSVREVYVRRLKALLPNDEESLRGLIELENRSLKLPTRPSGWNYVRSGTCLSDTTVGSAVARAATKIVGGAPRPVSTALLSTVAAFDPHLATCSRFEIVPDDWVELCRSETRYEESRLSHILRALGSAPRSVYDDVVEDDPSLLGEVACSRLSPIEPKDYAWISESWAPVKPPRFKDSSIVPFSFLNKPFPELPRTQYFLVPRWTLAVFRGLTYTTQERPGWSHPDLGPVVLSAFSEWQASGARTRVSWATAWYVRRDWFRRRLSNDHHVAVFSFWRREEGPDDDSDYETESQTSYGAEMQDL